MADEVKRPASYAEAGVDLVAADQAVDRIGPAIERTRRPEVLGGIGGFGGLFAFDTERWNRPVLVTGTDGVGTKLELARQLGRYDTVGIDLVAMVVDDIVVPGAEPLMFLDYIAVGKLDPDTVTTIVEGIAEGCVQSGCALVGGETAEHPGVMPADQFDLAGFGVGVVEHDKILGPDRVVEGDVLIGFESSGLHSNGYSLARQLVAGLDLSGTHGLDVPLGQALLEPTRIYAPLCLDLADQGLVHAFCHVTGGGLPGNLPRVMPDGLTAAVDRSTWTTAPLFGVLQGLGGVSDDEMFRAFNMGVGMVAVVAADRVGDVLTTVLSNGVSAWVLGSVKNI